MSSDARDALDDGEASAPSVNGPEHVSDRRCPVCSAAYESVSVHETGLMVNLLDNERYQRVCFEPTGGERPLIEFYHHTHEQAALGNES